MPSTYASAAIVTINGVDYDPETLQATQDDSWSPTWQGTCTIPTKSLVAPTQSARTNLFTNPSAAIDLAGASATNVALVRQAPASGFGSAHGTAFRLNGSAASSDSWMNMGGDSGAIRNGMAPGGTYTASATLYLDGPLAGTADAQSRARRIVVYAAGTSFALTAITASAQAPNAQGQYRLSVTFTLPTDTTSAFIRFYHGHAGTSAAYWTDLMLLSGNGLEADGTPVAFFDGDSLSTALYTYAWTGTADASTSTRTPAFVSTSTTPIVDPRDYPTIRVRQWAGDTAAPTDTPLYDIQVIVRTYIIDDVADTVTLTFASLECKLQEYANADADYAPGPMTVDAMVVFAMRKIGYTGLITGFPNGSVTIPAQSTLWRSGQSLDDWLMGATRSQGYELWYDPQTTAGGTPGGWRWYLLSNNGRGPTNPTIACKYGANILESNFGVDMDAGDFADAVVLNYNWVDSGGASHTKAYYARPVGPYRKVKVLNYTYADPGVSFAEPMRGWLARSGYTARLVLIASTAYLRNGTNPPIVDNLRLGADCQITRADGSQYLAIVKRVTYAYPQDTMELGLTLIRPWSIPFGTYFPIPGT